MQAPSHTAAVGIAAFAEPQQQLLLQGCLGSAGAHRAPSFLFLWGSAMGEVIWMEIPACGRGHVATAKGLFCSVTTFGSIGEEQSKICIFIFCTPSI